MTRKPIIILDTIRSRHATRRALKDANSDATHRTLGWDDLTDAIEEAETRLAHLPTCLWAGVTVEVNPHIVLDSAADHIKSTKATVTFDGRDWRLVSADRGRASRAASWVIASIPGVRVVLPAGVDRTELLGELLSSVGLSVRSTS